MFTFLLIQVSFYNCLCLKTKIMIAEEPEVKFQMFAKLKVFLEHCSKETLGNLLHIAMTEF